MLGRGPSDGGRLARGTARESNDAEYQGPPTLLPNRSAGWFGSHVRLPDRPVGARGPSFRFSLDL